MEFPEPIKKNAKEASAFKCCLCHEKPCFKVHHIDPAKGDVLENAAPLCADCHDTYGHDPSKRKHIKWARDWWWDYVKKRYSPERINHIRTEYTKISTELHDQKGIMTQLQSSVGSIHEKLNNVEKSISQGDYHQAQGILYNIGTAATFASTAVHGFSCRNCGTQIGLLVSNQPITKCPNCGAPI